MPEGPEVRRYALQLQDALESQPVVALTARTKDAKRWILEHPDALIGRRIETIRSHGKHLYGTIEGNVGFHSHLMMWGRWFVFGGDESVQVDKRERARIVTPKSVAVLFSAPIFEIFEGNPYLVVDNLRTLGPDVLPYDGPFDTPLFVQRLTANKNLSREIGAVLLDQRVCAGIGNYFRADLLFVCRINPWTLVQDLSDSQIALLCEQIPLMARRSLNEAGVSVPPAWRARLLEEASLHYNGRIVEWAARHAVFRRTNLPCLVCGTPIKQKQQTVYKTPDGDEENDKTRTIYFCPLCQNVDLEILVTPKIKRTKKPAPTLKLAV